MKIKLQNLGILKTERVRCRVLISALAYIGDVIEQLKQKVYIFYLLLS